MSLPDTPRTLEQFIHAAAVGTGLLSTKISGGTVDALMVIDRSDADTATSPALTARVSLADTYSDAPSRSIVTGEMTGKAFANVMTHLFGQVPLSDKAAFIPLGRQDLSDGRSLDLRLDWRGTSPESAPSTPAVGELEVYRITAVELAHATALPRYHAEPITNGDKIRTKVDNLSHALYMGDTAFTSVERNNAGQITERDFAVLSALTSVAVGAEDSPLTVVYKVSPELAGDTPEFTFTGADAAAVLIQIGAA